MRYRKYIIGFLICSYALYSCKKAAAPVALPTSPNVIDGCVIVQAQVVQTDLNSHQVHSYVDSYLYDSLDRVTGIWDGQHNDTDQYQYNGHDCNGEGNSVWQNSSSGYVLYASLPGGSYQYTYDGNGYLQLVSYTDSSHYGGDQSYTETYYWDHNHNLSSTIRLYASQPVPLTTTYSYYMDKPGQVLAPSSAITGHITADLPMQAVVTMGSTTVSTDTYTYVFDAEGKVAQYTDVTLGQSQTVYTLVYSCH